MSRSYLQPPGKFFGRQRQQAEAIKAGRALRAQLDFARYLQKRTANPVTHFPITCETSTASSKKKISPNLLSLSFLASFFTSERSPPTPTFSDGVNITLRRPHRWLITRRRDLARCIPISTSSTRLGSSLTISGARTGGRWL